MKSRVWIALIITLGCALAGCTASGGQGSNDPSDQVSAPPATVGTPSASATPSPTPTWKPDEQQAVDAVQQYLAVWAQVGHDVNTEDWDELWTVAADDAYDHAIETWRKWFDNDWHLIGAPVFTPSSVTQPMEDERGKRYVVRGCSVITDSHVVDANGAYVGEGTRKERVFAAYTVLRTLQDEYLLIDSQTEEETC